MCSRLALVSRASNMKMEPVLGLFSVSSSRNERLRHPNYGAGQELSDDANGSSSLRVGRLHLGMPMYYCVVALR